MNRSTRNWGSLLLLLGVLGTSCRRVEGPNVVLVTLDTTRADRLGAMGYAAAKTPVLDGLAARGVLFERAYASSPVTLPSHATMLTGLDPNLHGVHNNGSFIVPDSLDTVTERLRARGYRTGAFVSASVLDAAFGLNQGFEHYDAETPSEFDPPFTATAVRDGAETTDHALEWLGKSSGRAPNFLWVHYYDVHAPRRPPAPFNEAPQRYDGALAYVDAQVGRLLEGVEAAENGRETIVIVIGDHGESLGQHRELTHGTVAYDSTLHVPLIVTGPGFTAGQRAKNFVGTADVAPTILAALGEPLPARLSGRPLQARLAAPTDEHVAYFESMLPHTDFGWARLGGVRSGRWKLTAEPEPIELYDVEADPGERTNRASEESDVVARLTKLYQELRPATVVQAAEVPAALQEKLASLGYVTQEQRFEQGKEPDPRQAVELVTLVHRAVEAVYDGRFERGLAALKILSEQPIIGLYAMRRLGPMYLTMERYEEAVDVFQKLATATNNMQAQMQLAGALLEAGRPAEALEILDAIAKADPVRGELLRVTRARAYLAAEDTENAIREAAIVLEEDPWNDVVLAIDAAARSQKDPVGAIDRLQGLVSKAPKGARLIRARGLLADLLHERGRDREALEVLGAVAHPPLDQRALAADIAAAHGDLARAATLYEEIVKRSPEELGYAETLAGIYVALDRKEDAIRVYSRIVTGNPARASAYVGRGAVQFRLKRNAEAEADYRKALAIDEKIPEAAFNLSLLLLQRGEKDEAEKWLLKAVETRPDYGKAHFQLARIYHDRGDPRAALHAEKAASATNPARQVRPRGPGPAPQAPPEGAAKLVEPTTQPSKKSP